MSDRRVTPRAVAITVVAWLAALVCVVLGAWQWERGNVVVAQAPADLPVVPVAEVVSGGGAGASGTLSHDEVGRTVEVAGTFDPAVDLLVAGRQLDGRRGTWALGVVRLADGSGVPLVRGFVPAGRAAPPLPTGTVDVVGVVQPPEGSDVAPSSAALPVGQTWVVSAAELVNTVDYPVANAYVVDRAPADGLAAVPPADPGEASRRLDWRNLAYAGQWWVFASFALVVWVRALRDDRAEEHARGTPVGEPGGPPPADPGEDAGHDPSTTQHPGGRDMSGTR